ncbi:hypothetical protein [Armatimonas sp.]|uniref:hypothetical protein n=1 Tax=Armatimonas sp. TaxID=1872638 RepID=UPI0037530717
MNDEVSWNLTPAEQIEVDTAIATLQRVLGPKFKHLTPQDRQERPKMGDKTVAFVEKVLEYAESHPQFLPPYVEHAALVVDVTGVVALSPLAHALSALAVGAEDTRMLAGSEAYTAALAYYQSVKTAARRKIPGAEALYRDLAERFPGAPRKQPQTPTP